jgi:hypothetical protein
MIRVTMACPESLAGDANQLALCLGYGPQDAQTFGAALWRDAGGNRYALSSAMLDEAGLARLQGTLSAPGWECDLAAAGRAQDALRMGSAAAPDLIAVQAGPCPAEALAALGVTPAEPAGDGQG